MENVEQRVHCLIRTLKDVLERRLNARNPMFTWMVQLSAGLITRYVKTQTSKTAYREARDLDAQAPVAEFGETIMHMTSKNTSKSEPKKGAKFHDGI